MVLRDGLWFAERMRLVALKPDQPAAGAASADGGAAAAGTEDVPVDGAATGLQASSNVLITILKPPALQGFGSGEPDSPADGGHEQTGASAHAILSTTRFPASERLRVVAGARLCPW